MWLAPWKWKDNFSVGGMGLGWEFTGKMSELQANGECFLSEVIF